MDLTIVVTESGKKLSAEVFLDRQEAVEAFDAVDSGRVYLFKLRRNLAEKKRDFAGLEKARMTHEVVTHSDNPKALAKMSDAQLRVEARKRKLSLADNPLARRVDLIHQIQQHEQLSRDAKPLAEAMEQNRKPGTEQIIKQKAAKPADIAAQVESTSPPPPVETKTAETTSDGKE